MQMQMKHVQNEPIRVVYIMGCGYSGSTLLDVLLGSHPNITGVGEVRNLSYNERWADSISCSCGTLGGACPFWKDVMQHWFAHAGIETIASYRRLQVHFERVRHARFLLREHYIASPYFQTYARQTYALFKAIQHVSGAECIVDSSKVPLRAFALSMIPGIDLRVIHLVRDVRGVAWSFKRRFQKYLRTEQPKGLKSFKPNPVVHGALIWMLSNVLANRFRQRFDSHQALLCRYEDLVGNPRRMLAAIGNLIAYDFSETIEAVENNKPLQIGHIADGNGLRMNRSVHLRSGPEPWTKHLSPNERLMLYALTGRFMHQYGYV